MDCSDKDIGEEGWERVRVDVGEDGGDKAGGMI